MMKTVLVFLLIVLTQAVALAQDHPCELKVMQTLFPQKSSGASSGNCLTHDSLGNIYVAGTFEKYLKIGNKRLVSRGKSDIFIAKYNPKGEVLWVQSAGGEGTEEFPNEEEVAFIYIEKDTLNIVGCCVNKQAFFYSGNKLTISGSREHSFWMKVNLDGHWITGHNTTFCGLRQDHFAGEIPTPNGFIGISDITYQQYDSTFVHEPIEFVNIKLQFEKTNIGFVITHVDSLHQVKWWKPAEVIKGYAKPLLYGSGWGSQTQGYFFVGNYAGSFNIDDLTLTSNGGQDGFLLRINDDGKITHAETVGGTYDDEIRAVTVTLSGEVWITGSMQLKADEPPVFFLSRYGCR